MINIKRKFNITYFFDIYNNLIINFKKNLIVNISFLFSILIFIIFLITKNYLNFFNLFLLVFGLLLIFPFFIKNKILIGSLIIIIVSSGVTVVLGKVLKPLVFLLFFLMLLDYLSNKAKKIHWSLVHTFFVLYIILIVFSILFSTSYDYLNDELYKIIRGFAFFLLISELIIQFPKNKSKIAIFFSVNSIIIGSLLVSFAVIFMFLTNPMFYSLLLDKGGFFRGEGWIGDPNDLAIMLVICFGLLYPLIKGTKNFILKFFYIFSSIIVTITIILTLSRGGMLALFIVVCIIIFKERKSKKLWIIVCTIFVLLFIFYGDLVLTRLSTLSSSDSSLNMRSNLLKIGIAELMHSPLFGIGLGDYPEVTTHYLCKQGIPYPVVHNAYLHVAVETGLIGLLLYLSIFISIIKLLNKAIIYAKNTEQMSKVKYAEALKLSLISFFFPALFLSIHHNVFVFIYWAISVGVAISIIKGGKIGRKLQH